MYPIAIPWTLMVDMKKAGIPSTQRPSCHGLTTKVTLSQQEYYFRLSFVPVSPRPIEPFPMSAMQKANLPTMHHKNCNFPKTKEFHSLLQHYLFNLDFSTSIHTVFKANLGSFHARPFSLFWVSPVPYVCSSQNRSEREWMEIIIEPSRTSALSVWEKFH